MKENMSINTPCLSAIFKKTWSWSTCYSHCKLYYFALSCRVVLSCLVLSCHVLLLVKLVVCEKENKHCLLMVSVLKLARHDMLFGDDIGTLLSCWLKQCLVGSKEHTTRADYQGSMLCSAVPSSYRRPNNPAWAEPCPQWRGLTMFQVEWSDEMVTLCAARHCWPNTPTRTPTAGDVLDRSKKTGGGGWEKYQLLLLLLIRLERRITKSFTQKQTKVSHKSCTQKLHTKVTYKSYTQKLHTKVV